MFSAINLLPASLIVIAGVATGFALGKVNIENALQHTKDSYINRYLTMSGTQRQHITYYIYSKRADRVLPEVISIPGVVSIENAGPDHLFDVVIDYPKRREVVRALKEKPEIAAVFTVPLMCH